MEPRQQQTDLENGNKQPVGGFVCRQTSTRWTPTTDQIRILKDLYYNAGVRSPTADQIQKISARLRQYGKIEGKNVFYWFQNHKARERQKKRFNGGSAVTTMPIATTSDHPHHHQAIAFQRASSIYDNNHNNDAIVFNGPSGKPDHQDHLFHSRPSYPSFCNGNLYHASSGAECAINTHNGYIGSHGYGSLTMEKQFMDCSISPTGGSCSGLNVGGWVNMDHHYSSPVPPYSFFNKPKPMGGPEGYEGEQEEEEDDDDDDEHEDTYLENIRTLPLFPMHGEYHINGGEGSFRMLDRSDADRRGHVGRFPYASLELSLNSYTGVAPD